MKTASRFDNFPPYTPIEPFDVLSARLGIPVDQIVKLDANENLYGMSPRARQALASLNEANIYPDPESRALRKALCNYLELPEKNLLAGAGADELIDLILRVMIEPGDVVFNFPPTFGMYAFGAGQNAARLVEIPRREDFSLDLDKIITQAKIDNPKVIFLTSPNNPDGRLITSEEFDTIISLPALVVLDEAYMEFSGLDFGKLNSRVNKVLSHENLIVLRTFSKWAGLAGLRVGYGAFPDWLMPLLWKVKQPYNVNVAASRAAIASLEDLAFLKSNVCKITSERQRLFAALEQISFLKPYPSKANFILCKVIERPAKSVRDGLMENGIFVRYYENIYLQDYIRISVGRPQDTDRLMDGLRSIDKE